jgi:hypothetical protein
MLPRRNALAPLRLLAPIALLAACRGPAPIEATIDFQTERGIVRGVSTEDGLLALRDVVPESTPMQFRYRVGNGFFDDRARLVRQNDVLALLAPESSRPHLARCAGFPAARDDRLFIEVRDEEGPELLECRLLDEGRLGDLLVLDEGELEEVAHRFAGAGLFAWREGTMQLVGVLNGVYCEEPEALAFIGLDEMATLLPETSNYFVRRALPHRADFELGIPRDFEGERTRVSDPAPAEGD